MTEDQQNGCREPEALNLARAVFLIKMTSRASLERIRFLSFLYLEYHIWSQITKMIKGMKKILQTYAVRVNPF